MPVIQEIFVPKENVNDEYVTVVKIHVKNGDKVHRSDVLIDIETSKTIISIEAENDGFVELFCAEGDDVEVNSLLINIADDKIKKKNIEEEKTLVKPGKQLETETVFSEQALELIKKHKLDKNKFINADFVNGNDVLNFLKPKNDDIKEKVGKAKQGLLPEMNEQLIELKSLSKQKITEINYLSDVQAGLMTCSFVIAVDVKNIPQALADSCSIFNDSFLPLIVYETARLLEKYKIFNAYYVEEKVAFYKNINIGIAVDLNDGLKVLTLPDANTLNFSNIEDRLYQLIEKYLDKKLDLSDLTGATFTITDLSSSGVDFFTPLINTKQSAILGISRLDPKLNRFYMTLVFDHRLTEGKSASEFLVELKNRIESYDYLQSEANNKQELVAPLQDIKCGTCFKTLQEDREMDSHGFLKIINHLGQDEFICNVCFKGY